MPRLALATLLVLVVCVSPAAATTPANGPPASSSNVANLDASSSTCSYPISETDATGTTVTLASPPDRVVTLGASAAQTVWEIGGKSQVVGVTEYAGYLSGTGSLTKVGSWSIDTETVVGLQPDLVLAPNITSPETVRKLRSAGVTVYHFSKAESLSDIYAKTERTGRLVGRCDEAETRASKMRQQVARIREAVADTDRPGVYYLMGKSWYTAGQGTYIDTVVETAGGRNLATGSGYYALNPETIVANDPEWIARPRTFDLSRFSGTTAVSEGHVVELNADYISQPAPRIVIPMVKLVEKFHPKAYREAGLGDIDATDDGDTVVFQNASRRSVLRGDVAYLRVLGGESSAPTLRVPTALTEGDASPLSAVRVGTHEPVPVFTLLVSPLTAAEQPAPPAGVTMLSTYDLQGRELRGGTTSVTYTFDADAEAVAEAPGSTLSVYRVADGRWQQLETSVAKTNGTYRLTATGDDVAAVGVGVSASESVETSAGATTTPSSDDGGTATTPTPTATDATPTATGATPTPAGTETPANAPGFGVVVAVLGLLLAAMAARRP